MFAKVIVLMVILSGCMLGYFTLMITNSTFISTIVGLSSTAILGVVSDKGYERHKKVI